MPVNISGMTLTMYIASQLVAKKKFPIHYFLISGFGLMLAFNFWMYKIISPGLDFSDLMIPIFLQGASSGMLFVPIATFILSSVPVHSGISGSLVGGTVRFYHFKLFRRILYVAIILQSALQRAIFKLFNSV